MVKNMEQRMVLEEILDDAFEHIQDKSEKIVDGDCCYYEIPGKICLMLNNRVLAEASLTRKNSYTTQIRIPDLFVSDALDLLELDQGLVWSKEVYCTSIVEGIGVDTLEGMITCSALVNFSTMHCNLNDEFLSMLERDWD